MSARGTTAWLGFALVVLGAGCGSSALSGRDGAAPDGSGPPIVCNAGCLCAKSEQSCPAGCYRFYAEADAGLEIKGCYNGPPADSERPADGALSCTYDNGGAPGKPTDFGGACPKSGCPAGTVCVAEVGGVAGGGGEYCAPIPFDCHGTPTCACMGSCACRSGVGLRPERCSEGAGLITCDNGVT
ncbi:MAG: hypothetical protein JWM82_2374 [Myxococcales bacterium]|nr:hypothetical protein [Myxococcales bacterium]